MNNVHFLSLLFCFPIMVAILFPIPSAGDDAKNREYLTRSGKSLLIKERHPVGHSLSDISITSTGFAHNRSEVFKNRDLIKSVHVADLDANGFDEFYIITGSSGSGNYGNVIGFDSNRDKSLSMIYFPEIREGDELFDGEAGWQLKIIESSIDK